MGREGSVTYTISGASGKQYTLDTYTKDTTFKDISAVYIFTKRYKGSQDKYFQDALYIGESAELGTRIANHEKWPCVNRNGCTHISIMQISGETARENAETDLRNGNTTPCNDQ